MFLSLQLPEGQKDEHLELVQQIMILGQTIEDLLGKSDSNMAKFLYVTLRDSMVDSILKTNPSDFILVDDLTKAYEKSGLIETIDLHTFSSLVVKVLHMYFHPVYDEPLSFDDCCMHDEPEEIYNGM